jgi:hypothetical protein
MIVTDDFREIWQLVISDEGTVQEYFGGAAENTNTFSQDNLSPCRESNSEPSNDKEWKLKRALRCLMFVEQKIIMLFSRALHVMLVSDTAASNIIEIMSALRSLSLKVCRTFRYFL